MGNAKRFALAVLMTGLAGLTGCVTSPASSPAPTHPGQRQLTQGVELFAEDNYPLAAERFQQAVDYFRSVDDPAGIVDSRINLLETALRVGNLAAARRQLEQARQIANRADLQPRLQRLSLLAARLLAADNQAAMASTQLDELLEQPSLDTELQLSALAWRAELAIRSAPAQAEPWLVRYAEAIDRAKDPAATHKARVARLRADQARALNAGAMADQAYRRALTGFRQAHYRPGLATTLQNWAALALTQGKHTQARNRVQRALYIRLWMLDRPGAIAAFQTWAAIETGAGAPKQAAAARAWARHLEQTDQIDWGTVKQALEGARLD